jgi:DNA repair protein RecN (Recombination protein N)
VLDEIRISGLGVIAEATLDLSPRLTVVTGETGAGKTMVVTALGLLFGGRADPARVRGGAGSAVVEGRLLTAGGGAVRAVLDRAAEAGAEADEDGTLLLSRSVSAEGRSRAHLGGRAVPMGVLSDVGELVLTVHGQSDQLRLLKPAEQRAALDRYAGGGVTDLVASHRELYERWQAVTADLAERTGKARERSQEADVLRFGLGEVEAVDPQPGEDDELRAESRRLEHADGLRTAASTAHEALAGDPMGSGDGADVAALLGAARRALDAVSDDDAELAALAQRTEGLAALAADLAADLAAYAESLDTDPARLAAVHDRRAALTGLTRKYADSVDGVLAWAETARERLLQLDSSTETLAALAAERDALAAELGGVALKLSAARQEAAVDFGVAVTEELAGLAMPHARVEAVVETREPGRDQPALTIDGREVGVGPDGIDEVELRLIAHPGAPALPLQRGASGGELSRVMLAVEVVFAGTGGTPTMVFDEVDAGVGGRAAVEVGRRLARLSRTHQVVVVTHLPQVAAFADRHLLVSKDVDGRVTTSGVRLLDDADRARELSRMLAGLEDSELGVAHAEELLATARAEKERPVTRRGGRRKAATPTG